MNLVGHERVLYRNEEAFLKTPVKNDVVVRLSPGMLGVQPMHAIFKLLVS